MKNVKILIVDDQVLFFQSMGGMLKLSKGLNVIGYAENGAVALKKMVQLEPDLVLLDLEMPVMDGIDTAREIVRRFPRVKILVISMHEEITIILELLKIGISGYVPKHCDFDLLVTAIEKVIRGEKFLSKSVAQKIQGFNPEEDQIKPNALNETEKEIIRQMAFGKRDKDIIDVLKISINTHKFHKENIRNKTGMETPAQFGAYAVRHKLVDPRDFRLK